MAATDIDDVLEKLKGIIEANKGSPRAFFPAVYRATTARVRAGVQNGSFSNGDRMVRFVTGFANRYLAAYEASARGAEHPRAWKVAFDSVSRPHTMILQHVLVGMNAHINYDLPLAVIESAGAGPLSALEDDFNAINDILESLLDPVQDVIDKFSPMMNLLDELGSSGDEALVTFSIKTAREEAWHEATRLAGESLALRERSRVSLDRRVALLASNIIVPDGPLGLATGLIARTESRDLAAVAQAMLAIT